MVVTLLGLSIGFVVLTTGRQLCWLFAGGISFAWALLVLPALYGMNPDMDLLIMALGIGISIGVLTSMLGRIMVAIALSLSGIYLLVMVPGFLGFNISWLTWTLFLFAWAVTALMMLTWYDFSIILLSSLTGASLIIYAIDLNPLNKVVAYFAMAVFGMLAQAIINQYLPISEEV